MAILLDYSQVCIGAITMQAAQNKNEVDIELAKHMILNSIRLYLHRFGTEYGKLIVCVDSVNGWRKDIFPHYKAKRKAGRDKSALDWNEIYRVVKETKEELKLAFPYHVVEVPRCEADDIIAVLAKDLCPQEPVLIISGDKDFHQLQKHGNIKQYAPIQKKMITGLFDLKEHIMKGDTSDGIPNIWSAGDTLITDGLRQTPATKKKLEQGPISENEKARYAENEKLINLDLIPQNFVDEILEAFKTSRNVDTGRDTVNAYFIEKKMRQMAAYLPDFFFGQPSRDAHKQGLGEFV